MSDPFPKALSPAMARALRRNRTLSDALRQLVDAAGYVVPIAGAVATEPSVKRIRQAGRFIKAMDNARAVLAKAGA